MPVGALVASQGSARQRVRAVLDSELPPTLVPSSISFTPSPFSVAVGATVQLTAVVLDQLGQEMAGQTVAWASDNAAVATVHASTGVVTGVGSGTCSITASVTGANISKAGACTVSPAAVASVDLTPTSLSLTVGGSSGTFTAQPRDASGNALAGRTVTAPSSNSGLATTSVSGYTITVSPVAVGSPTVTATCETIASPTRTVTVVAAAADHEPADVTMTPLVSGDLTTETLNSAFTQFNQNGGVTFGGLKWYTGASNMRVQLLSDQSWRQDATAFPVSPSGLDRVLACRMAPSGGGITAGEKGNGEFSASGVKTLYGRYYALISSNFVGNPISGLKRHYIKTATAGPVIVMYYGSGSNAIRFRAHYQAPNANVVEPASGLTMTRNTWYLVEYVVVLPGTANGTDGHFTLWLDGVKSYQRTNVSFDQTTLNIQQWLHYMGGSGTATQTEVQYVLTGDGYYFSGSTSRAGVPA